MSNHRAQCAHCPAEYDVDDISKMRDHLTNAHTDPIPVKINYRPAMQPTFDFGED